MCHTVPPPFHNDLTLFCVTVPFQWTKSPCQITLSCTPRSVTSFRTALRRLSPPSSASNAPYSLRLLPLLQAQSLVTTIRSLNLPSALRQFILTGASCSDIYQSQPSTPPDGIYNIVFQNEGAVQLYCDMQNGGWTRVISWPGSVSGRTLSSAAMSMVPSTYFITLQNSNNLCYWQLEQTSTEEIVKISDDMILELQGVDSPVIRVNCWDRVVFVSRPEGWVSDPVGRDPPVVRKAYYFSLRLTNSRLRVDGTLIEISMEILIVSQTIPHLLFLTTSARHFKLTPSVLRPTIWYLEHPALSSTDVSTIPVAGRGWQCMGRPTKHFTDPNTLSGTNGVWLWDRDGKRMEACSSFSARQLLASLVW